MTPLVIKGEGNQVVHFEWDSFIRITTNIMGSNFVNTSDGIIIQEIKPDFDIGFVRIFPVFDRKNSSLEKVMTESQPRTTCQTKVGPKFPEDAEFSPRAPNEKENQSGLKVYYIWLFARLYGGQEAIQAVPGFVSATVIKPLCKSTIEYMTPVQQSFTEYSSMKELLRWNEEATVDVGQKYSIP